MRGDFRALVFADSLQHRCHQATISFDVATSLTRACLAFPLSIESAAIAAAWRKIIGHSRDDETGASVQKHNVAKRSRLSIEEPADRIRIGRTVAALQCLGARSLKPGILRHNLEGPDLAIGKFAHRGRTCRRQLVEPVAAMNDPHSLRAQILQNVRQGLDPGAVEHADDLA